MRTPNGEAARSCADLTGSGKIDIVAVGRATGREMVLNTSFNVKGQPIVNTPAEAMETFLGTGIEFLFLENTLISRAK